MHNNLDRETHKQVHGTTSIAQKTGITSAKTCTNACICTLTPNTKYSSSNNAFIKCQGETSPTKSHSVLKRLLLLPVLWWFIMSDSKHWPSKLSWMQTLFSVISNLVIMWAATLLLPLLTVSNECTMTTARRSTWKEHSRKPLNAAATWNHRKENQRRAKWPWLQFNITLLKFVKGTSNSTWKNLVNKQAAARRSLERSTSYSLTSAYLTSCERETHKLFCQETVKYDRGNSHQCASTQ